jgi:hypothetical protein
VEIRELSAIGKNLDEAATIRRKLSPIPGNFSRSW